MSRRGTTLVELMIALILLAAAMLLAGTMVGGIGSEARRTTRAATAERTGGTLATLLRFELADAMEEEVLLETPRQLRFPRRIGDAIPCATSGPQIGYPLAEWSGVRRPEADRDAALIYDDAGWHRSLVRGVASAICPDGRDALVLTLADATAHPVYLRVVEMVRLTIYRSGPADWFGLAPGDGSSPVQPFAGPLVAGSGVIALDPDGLRIATAIPAGAALTLAVPVARGAP